MKIKKIIMPALLLGIFGLGSGFALSGCSGANDSLEKAHIMNNGCFITCYNKGYNEGYNKDYNKTGEGASAESAGNNIIKNSAGSKSRNIIYNVRAYSKKIEG